MSVRCPSEEGRRKKEEERGKNEGRVNKLEQFGNYQLANSQTTKTTMASQKKFRKSACKLGAEDSLKLAWEHHQAGRLLEAENLYR